MESTSASHPQAEGVLMCDRRAGKLAGEKQYWTISTREKNMQLVNRIKP